MVDAATSLEALFLEIGVSSGTRADDSRRDSLCQTLCASVSCELGFFGWHGERMTEDPVLRILDAWKHSTDFG
jgi:hypothetical protein